jgi:hypothetical protein
VRVNAAEIFLTHPKLTRNDPPNPPEFLHRLDAALIPSAADHRNRPSPFDHGTEFTPESLYYT